jgi:hypothetical protein
MLYPPLSPETAGSVVRGTIKPFDQLTDHDVRELVAYAVRAAHKVQYRLTQFSADADEAARAARWNNGAEAYWFAAYDPKKLASLRSVFDRIPEILQDRHLKIVCDPKLSSYASALPGIRRIRLGQLWLAADRFEQIQTFVHEASHIAGRMVADESKWYQPAAAHQQALIHRPLRPRMALRNADNLGYYAMEISDNFVTSYLYS